MLTSVLRNDRLLGWDIVPLGESTLFLSEPPIAFILLNALFPAAIASLVLYIGLFTALPSPIVLPHRPLVEALVIAGGILLTSTGNFFDSLRHLRFPLWGQAPSFRS